MAEAKKMPKTRMRVKMREIFTCIHFHFQHFYVLALIFFFFSTFSLSKKAKRRIDAGRGPKGGTLSIFDVEKVK